MKLLINVLVRNHILVIDENIVNKYEIKFVDKVIVSEEVFSLQQRLLNCNLNFVLTLSTTTSDLMKLSILFLKSIILNIIRCNRCLGENSRSFQGLGIKRPVCIK